MKLSLNWLSEWFSHDIALDDLSEKLTMVGLEVSEILSVANKFSKVVVGQVLTAEQHPDADRLHVCTVDVGDKMSLGIVCGASNVRPGLKVPVALVGATIGDLEIKKTKLRGIVSNGMMCSDKELGLAQESNGLLELPEDAPIGQDIRKYLQLDDSSIEVDLTPNRGDCASVLGIAREVSAIYNKPYRMPKISAIKPTINDIFPVKLHEPKFCPRYVGRVIRGINVDATTPWWLKEKLRRSGLHSVHPVVDVMNYVMLELGQPMHAFDLAKLHDYIEVRFAKPKESIVLLGNIDKYLDAETLVIADSKRALAIAGVLGGSVSAVARGTTDIFLESAFFDPKQIVKNVSTYKLTTDASYRFERGVDFELQELAIERATGLLLDIVGGEAAPVIHVKDKSHLSAQKTVLLRADRVRKVLGLDIPDKIIENILTKLNMSLKKQKNKWQVKVPSFRFDIELEEDLIEEVARIYGYNELPLHTYQAPMHLSAHNHHKVTDHRIRTKLADCSYHEVVTYSFVDPKLQQLLEPREFAQPLINPIASDMSVMRTSLWVGLLQVFQYNHNRQQSRIRLFEIGKRFRQVKGNLCEEKVLSGLVYGEILPEQWGHKAHQSDFYDVKGDIEQVLRLTSSARATFSFEPTSHHALHPGQCAAIKKGDAVVGYVGAIHPAVAKSLNVSAKIYLFEYVLDAVNEKEIPIFSPISKFPSIRRDLAFIVQKDISAGHIESKIREVVGNLLIELVIFDVYLGDACEKDAKSVALGLTLQDSSRTLVDKEVVDIIERVIKTLRSDLGAKLRE
ncbi:MAG: phenylalanine--tRNA ligase subunit beta [Gammaproteobacteria bacterium RIFCSPHIGHO2_02_FULL_42_13]|nr:MAG: phenylalanine--tRNA ligase subunit beta [Gammaproteobacteria bacterium RIFCSPHIGHO2_02_FULL_42_13]